MCGEYISLESWNFLKRLGIGLEDLHLPVIKTLQLSDTKGNRYAFGLPLGGFGISRYVLDNLLYKLAIAKGVTVNTKAKVTDVVFEDDRFTISLSQTKVIAKVAAGCYGKRSNLDVKWKRPFVMQKAGSLNNYIGIKYHIKYDHDNEIISLHNFYNGYCGLSGIEEGKSCLCYLTTAENLRKSGNSIDELQQKILYKNPWLQHIFTHAEFLYHEPLAISQISFTKKQQVEQHVLMLGDAAGLITPLCGNGMSIAMHSGKIAFENLRLFFEEKINRDVFEKKYETEWKRVFAGRLWLGRQVQSLFGGEKKTSLFLSTMNVLPPLARFVIKSTHGTSF